MDENSKRVKTDQITDNFYITNDGKGLCFAVSAPNDKYITGRDAIRIGDPDFYNVFCRLSDDVITKCLPSVNNYD